MTTCLLCKNRMPAEPDAAERYVITGGLCGTCSGTISRHGDPAPLHALIEAIDAPVLVMEGQPRQVYAANSRALHLFGKGLDGVVGHRGGSVFDCLYSFTEAGCGMDKGCDPCRIRGAVVDALTMKVSSLHVINPLQIRKDKETTIYEMQVSTEAVGDLVLLRIDRYRKAWKEPD